MEVAFSGLYWPSAVLVIGAIFVGNAAYEAGNITGAAAGLPISNDIHQTVWPIVIGVAALIILGTGKRHWIERTLMTLVACMHMGITQCRYHFKFSVYRMCRLEQLTRRLTT